MKGLRVGLGTVEIVVVVWTTRGRSNHQNDQNNKGLSSVSVKKRKENVLRKEYVFSQKARKKNNFDPKKGQ